MGKGSPCKRFREGVGRAGRFTVDSGKLRDAQGCSGSSSGPREPREPAESKRATVRSTEPQGLACFRTEACRLISSPTKRCVAWFQNFG